MLKVTPSLCLLSSKNQGSQQSQGNLENQPLGPVPLSRALSRWYSSSRFLLNEMKGIERERETFLMSIFGCQSWLDHFFISLQELLRVSLFRGVFFVSSLCYHRQCLLPSSDPSPWPCDLTPLSSHFICLVYSKLGSW